MKKVILALFLVAPLLGFTQKNSWDFIKSTKGFDLYWAYVEELKDQYRCELKLVNKNSFAAYVSFTPVFECSDGSRYKGIKTGASLKPGAEKKGQWEGWFWYPCKNGAYPTGGGWTDASFTQED